MARVDLPPRWWAAPVADGYEKQERPAGGGEEKALESARLSEARRKWRA